MFVALVVIIIGIIIGAASFIPLWGGLQLAKRVTSTSNLSHAGSLLLAVFGSALVLFGAAVICILVDRADALPFVLAEVGGITVTAIVFGVKTLVVKK